MSEAIRIDRWLWFARFFKSRSLAAKLVQARKVRVNKVVVGKASAPVKCGDVLTFPQGRQIRVVRIEALGARRGPAPEAQALYVDLVPPEPGAGVDRIARRETGAGRPTKADRRAIDRLRDSPTIGMRALKPGQSGRRDS